MLVAPSLQMLMGNGASSGTEVRYRRVRCVGSLLSEPEY